jgi:hypothetical protein
MESEMPDKEELREQIAACLQARMSWPKADACADDLIRLFEYKNWI